MDRNLLILGILGHGKVIKEIAEVMGTFDAIDFLDDDSDMAIGTLSESRDLSDKYKYAFVALKDSQERMKWIERLEGYGYSVPALVHPSAHISPSAIVKSGTLIMAEAVINANVIIDKGCIIDLGAIIDHDTIIGAGVHIDCGAIIKTHCVIDAFIKVESGRIVTKDQKLHPAENPEANDFSFEDGV